MWITIYRILSNLLYLPIFIFFFLRLLFSKETLLSILQKFFLSKEKRPNGELIWINAVSIGESKTGIVIAEEIKKIKPNCIILFSTSTITSYELLNRIKKIFIVIFTPVDISFVIKSFIKYWKPNSVIFIESEIWPNIFSIVKNNSIKLTLLNARISKKSFSNWTKFNFLSKSIFPLIDNCFVQDKESIRRFKLLGVRNLSQMENLKFLSQKLVIDNSLFNKFEKQLKFKKVITLFSSHKDEEKMFIESYKILSKRIKDLFFIIIPRHIDRLGSITNEFKKKNVSYILKTNYTFKDHDANFLIVDTFGELGVFFKLSQIALVGGSFSKNGGHNPIETKDFNCSLIFGPHMDNFKEIKKDIIKYKAGFEAKNLDQLIEIISKLLKDRKLNLKTVNNFKKLCKLRSDKSKYKLRNILK